jgi:hypothetical protein
MFEALVDGQEEKLIRVCCVNGCTIFSSLLQGREGLPSGAHLKFGAEPISLLPYRTHVMT